MTDRRGECRYGAHLSELRSYLDELASADRYVSCIHDVSGVTGLDVTPRALRTERDIELFAPSSCVLTSTSP